VYFGQKVNIEHEYKVEVGISESVAKFYTWCHLAVKSLWRHFRKLKNVLNGALWTKTYFWTRI